MIWKDRQHTNKAGYTATKVACEWVGAVMIKAYSNILAGAVMQKTPKMPKKLRATDRQTDGHGEL